MRIIERQNKNDQRVVVSSATDCLKVKGHPVYSAVFVIEDGTTLEQCEQILEECAGYPEYKTEENIEEIRQVAIDELLDLIQNALGIDIRSLLQVYYDNMSKPPDTEWNPPYTRKNKHDIVTVIYARKPYLLIADYTMDTPDKQGTTAWQLLTWDQYYTYNP